MKLAICWHMHQPYYRDELHGQYRLPWVYLHAMKDYTDMAWHLEQHPKMKLVVNFAPVLLEQLLDYEQQLALCLEQATPIQDRLLSLLHGSSPIPADSKERWKLIKNCQRCNIPTMMNPWPAYKALVDHADHLVGAETKDLDALAYLDDQYFYDLLTWYHLAWLGHSIKQDKRIQKLLAKARLFSEDNRHTLLQVIHECVAGIIPRYRRLAESGQIELSMTPWGHPIIPLLNDFNNMACSMPDAPLPCTLNYPGGVQRSRWHIEHGLELFESCFGIHPHGMWLSEGSVSQDALELLDEFHIKWTASGESVWHNSAKLSGIEEKDIRDKRGLFNIHGHESCECRIFFRDDGLSDLIGFEYSKWVPEDAVANFAMHIKNIAQFLGKDADKHVISVILDGENAWEYFPDNGFSFLHRLYDELVDNKHIEPVTFSEAAATLPHVSLNTICPGSWVFGSFSTWIGEKDKNRAWDLLVEAKYRFDDVMQGDSLDDEQRRRATRQLAICEGSDWFWWFGDYNSAESVQDFDQLYRCQLSMLYKLLNLAPPPSLDIPLSHGSAHGQSSTSGTMRRNNA